LFRFHRAASTELPPVSPECMQLPHQDLLSKRAACAWSHVDLHVVYVPTPTTVLPWKYSYNCIGAVWTLGVSTAAYKYTSICCTLSHAFRYPKATRLCNVRMSTLLLFIFFSMAFGSQPCNRLGIPRDQAPSNSPVRLGVNPSATDMQSLLNSGLSSSQSSIAQKSCQRSKIIVMSWTKDIISFAIW
jgi:hypothetical protein